MVDRQLPKQLCDPPPYPSSPQACIVGTSQDKVCVCGPFWAGDDCSIPCLGGAALPCSGNGICNDTRLGDGSRPALALSPSPSPIPRPLHSHGLPIPRSKGSPLPGRRHLLYSTLQYCMGPTPLTLPLRPGGASLGTHCTAHLRVEGSEVQCYVTNDSARRVLSAESSQRPPLQ